MQIDQISADDEITLVDLAESASQKLLAFNNKQFDAREGYTEPRPFLVSSASLPL
jgi:hypothetical protein